MLNSKKGEQGNIWNAKRLVHPESVKYEDFVYKRKEPVLSSLDQPLRKVVAGDFTVRNLVTKELDTDLLVMWCECAPGGGHDYHAHSHEETVIILENELKVVYRSTDDKDVAKIFKKGDTAYFPIGTPHSVWNVGEKVCTYITLKWNPPFWWEDLPLPPEVARVRCKELRV